MPPLPAGHGAIEHPFGVLTNFRWCGWRWPCRWRGASLSGRAGQLVRRGSLLFGIGALTMSLFFVACTRYEVEFLPTLVLLAVVGILSLERALAPTSESGQADHPVWRRAVRWGWSLLLGFSVAFNLLVSVEALRRGALQSREPSVCTRQGEGGGGRCAV